MYEYDYIGKCMKKVILLKMEMYYYNGDNLLYIIDGSNKLCYSFGWDVEDNLVIMIDYIGVLLKMYIYVFNYCGDVVGMLDVFGN